MSNFATRLVAVSAGVLLTVVTLNAITFVPAADPIAVAAIAIA